MEFGAYFLEHLAGELGLTLNNVLIFQMNKTALKIEVIFVLNQDYILLTDLSIICDAIKSLWSTILYNRKKNFKSYSLILKQ